MVQSNKLQSFCPTSIRCNTYKPILLLLTIILYWKNIIWCSFSITSQVCVSMLISGWYRISWYWRPKYQWYQVSPYFWISVKKANIFFSPVLKCSSSNVQQWLQKASKVSSYITRSAVSSKHSPPLIVTTWSERFLHVSWHPLESSWIKAFP